MSSSLRRAVLVDPATLSKSEYTAAEWPQVCAESRSGPFADGECAQVVPLSLFEECVALLCLFFIFPGPALWVPLGAIYALCVCSWATCAAWACVGVAMAVMPVQFRSQSVIRSYPMRLMLRYFSFRVAFDSPPDASRHGIMVSTPHGVVPVGSILMILFTQLYCGIHVSGIAASGAR